LEILKGKYALESLGVDGKPIKINLKKIDCDDMDFFNSFRTGTHDGLL
jgi:hypothetical protein